MSEQNFMTLQQYAIKHKMSTFAVVKLINAKKLKTIKKTVDEEEIEYIVDDSISSTTPAKSEPTPESEQSTKIDYEVEFHKLLAKYVEIQDKYTKLIEERNHATK